jgi:beta-lactamase class A
MSDAAARRIDAAFRAIGLRGNLHAIDLATGREVAVAADAPVVLASVFKVALVTALYRRHEAGELDVAETVEVRGGGGATGVAAMLDPARLSLRDLAYLAIAVSDNAAAAT